MDEKKLGDSSALPNDFIYSIDLSAFNLLQQDVSLVATRKGFDRLYDQLNININPNLYVEEVVNRLQTIVSDPEMLDVAARYIADTFKNHTLVRSISAAAEKLEVSQEKTDAAWGKFLNLDVDNFDPHLTECEKSLIEYLVSIINCGAKRGYYISSATDAPVDSKWALSVKREVAERSDEIRK